MRLGRLFIIIAIVLILGVGGLFFVAQSLGGGGEEDVPEEAITLVDVVIVEQFVPRGGTITSEMLGFAKLNQDQVFPDIYILNPSDIEGARARYDLLPGAILTRPMLLAPGEGLTAAGSDTSLDIQPGMVAIAIPIDRFSSVGYGLQRGDHVNIIVSLLFVDIDTEFQTILPNSTAGLIAPGNTVILTVGGEDGASTSINSIEELQTLTLQSVTGGISSPKGRTEFDSVFTADPFYVVPSEPSQRPRLVSQTILQDSIVIHVGNFPLPEELAQSSAQASDQPQPGDPNAQPQDVQEETVVVIVPPDIITLMVFPQEAVTLNYLMLRGAYLSLVMRASGDDSRVFTEAVTLDWLLANHNIPVPARLPYGFEPALNRIISPGARDILDLILSGNEQ